MEFTSVSRRGFLDALTRSSVAGALAFELPWVAMLAACAPRDNAYRQLAPAEARALSAFAAQIIPSDESGPGAVELGVVDFIDRAMSQPFFADAVSLLRAGLADLDARAHAKANGKTFAALSNAQQTAILREIERDPFFVAARNLVVIGTFADPSYGGNRNHAGWMVIGMEHKPSYSAPFGYYDAEVATNARQHAERNTTSDVARYAA